MSELTPGITQDNLLVKLQFATFLFGIFLAVCVLGVTHGRLRCAVKVVRLRLGQLWTLKTPVQILFHFFSHLLSLSFFSFFSLFIL